MSTRRTLALFVLIVLAAGLAAHWIPAQEAPAVPPAGPGVRSPAAPGPPPEETRQTARDMMSWQHIVKRGGWPIYVLMFLLLALSFLTVAFIVYFFVVLTEHQVVPRHLYRDVMDKIKAGTIDDARRTCEYRRSPLSAVTLAAMDYMRDIPEIDAVLLKDVVEGEGGRQAEALMGQTQYLLDIAVVAPMVGLLGTVLGVWRAFGSVAHEIASAKPVVLAEGVAQALLTTVFGLTVGIPAMIFYAYFRRRASKLVSYLEVASTDVLTALLGRKSHELPR
jgi:biopolymer transport protein ExbB